MNENYQNALAEVNVILQLLPKDLFKKIPSSLLQFVEQKKSKTYIPHMNLQQPIQKQKLLKETKIILSLIYRNYLCDAKQKRKLEIEDEIELRKKYSYKNLFKKEKKNL